MMSNTPADRRPHAFCDSCGSQAAFIVEHQRWYCSKCRKYLNIGIEQPVPTVEHQQANTHPQVAVGHQYTNASPPPPPVVQHQYTNASPPPAYHAGAPPHQYPSQANYQQPQPVYQQAGPYNNYPLQPQPVQQYGYAQQNMYHPNMPNENMAKAKVHNSVSLRNRSDNVISTAWPAILIIIQLALIGTTILGFFFIFSDLSFIDPYTSGIPSEFILLFGLAFIMQLLFTIVQSYLVYILVLRMDDHFERDSLLRMGLLEYLDSRSMVTGTDINVERWTINTINMSAYMKERKKGAITWAIMVGLFSFIPVVGTLFLLYILHSLTDNLIDHDFNQLNFNRQLNWSLAKLNRPLVGSGGWMNVPRRSTGMYIILTLITLGFFLPYWWYVVITDWNEHFQNQWKFEDELLYKLSQE